ncbi:hypothetical protein VC83_07157 [Pseudogymnoascus destructans]|uniref:Uncharacterized protein n=1 Tax=Pseudogymnoascus destructans TaxID=655981 RepID=A0A177A6P0_9PEZI|nr:uncharacterized protein VC83_07157 [Pseudogymnoascus destructans]OAF56684.1 hypothetical protein VC83_07157 [Pseudogymnoascus destructans]
MPAVGQVFVEDLSEVFVDANIHIYLPPAARESLPRPLPMLATRVYTTVPYGTPGNVRLEHLQEIAGFYIQAAGENVAQVSQVRSMGYSSQDDREPTPPLKDDTPRPGERAGTRAHARKLALEAAQRNGGRNAV